ncbi:MAG: cation transporter [Acidimicrobiales bacterium]
MHNDGHEAPATEHLEAGVRVSVASIVWTVTSGAAAVVIGLSARSLVLAAFGFTGLLDAAGSTALVVHFRHALSHDAVSEGHERRAMRVITAGLVLVGTLTAVESARRLVVGVPAAATKPGLALAATSIGVLGVFAIGKNRIAGRIPSRALRADGWLSGTGCLLAVVTVAGTGLASAYGWWWADPVAASAVAFGAIWTAGAMARDSPDPRP